MSRMIPEKIKERIGAEVGQMDDIGLSGANVCIYENMVLKMAPADVEAADEIAAMKWLKGKLPVPEVLETDISGDTSYLLMSKAKGKMSCDVSYMKQGELLTRLLAEALKMLWQVDVTDCPTNVRLEERLNRAEYKVIHGLIDTENVEEGTYGEGGFAGPEELLAWLRENRPEEDLVLTHGDFCLPNIFFDGDNVSGYIDLGKCGVADRYQDIALCYRSLKYNAEGVYGGEVYEGIDPEMLFEYLEIEPDWEKMKYYLLLDELF